MRFDWDDEKAESNYKKHGVTFEVAMLVFDDPEFVMYLDRDADGEARWHTIGRVMGALVFLVAHTFEEENEEEIVRIISAREVTAHERRRYENGQQ